MNVFIQLSWVCKVIYFLKSKKILFVRILFNKTLHCLESFCSENYFILAKIFIYLFF